MERIVAQVSASFVLFCEREGGRGAEVYCEGEVWGQFVCVKEREVWAYSFAVSRGGRLSLIHI